jgi:hypothetical protein
MQDWPASPRMPLGDPYEGSCCAPGVESQPAGEVLRECCNFGYARGRCERFPSEEKIDAVRITAWTEPDGATEFQYVLEGNHAPLEHGRVRLGGSAPEAVMRLLRAFAESYRKQ